MTTPKSYKINGKYHFGLPNSVAWKSKTPWKLKLIGEIIILVSCIVNIITAQYEIPVLIVINSILIVVGRWFIKMFGERQENPST